MSNFANNYRQVTGFRRDGDLLSYITAHAEREPDAAFCTGCHGDKPVHLMISHAPDRRTHLTVGLRRPEDQAAWDQLKRALKRRGLPYSEIRLRGPGPSREIRFVVPA